MATLTLAFYKGPPRNDWQHTLSHYGIRLWTWSRYSHAELVLADGTCWSSSARDGGVRAKTIDLTSGRWDVCSKEVSDAALADAVRWFERHRGRKYDWAGVLRFVIPFLPQSANRFFCFEAIARALGFPAAHKFTATDLLGWVRN